MLLFSTARLGFVVGVDAVVGTVVDDEVLTHVGVPVADVGDAAVGIVAGSDGVVGRTADRTVYIESGVVDGAVHSDVDAGVDVVAADAAVDVRWGVDHEVIVALVADVGDVVGRVKYLVRFSECSFRASPASLSLLVLILSFLPSPQVYQSHPHFVLSFYPSRL